MGKTPDEIRTEIEDTRAQMSDTVEAIGYRTDVKSRAKDSLTDKKDAVVSAVTSAKEAIVGTATDGADAVTSTLHDALPDPDQAKQNVKQAIGVAQNNPLGLAIGGAAIGFLAGIAVPASRAETRRLQPVADQIKESAANVGEQAIEHGKQIAQDTANSAVETAKESSQAHGQAIADALTETVHEATSTEAEVVP